MDYLCDRFGPNTVKHINLALKDKKYTPDIWLAVSGGIPVETLWEQYCEAFNLKPPNRPGGGAKDSDYLVVSNDKATTAQGPAKTPVQQPPTSTTSATSTATAASGSNVSVAPPESSAPSDVWPFSGDTPLAHVMVDRLKHMTFDGTSDATRYILEFEALIDRLQPEMTDEDKKLLLVCILPLFEVFLRGGEALTGVGLVHELSRGKGSELVRDHMPRCDVCAVEGGVAGGV